jgi:hypothetical protein
MKSLRIFYLLLLGTISSINSCGHFLSEGQRETGKQTRSLPRQNSVSNLCPSQIVVLLSPETKQKQLKRQSSKELLTPAQLP